MPKNIYTIGHSNHSLEGFIDLLRRHSITAVADVRSQPYSRYNPQFNRETLAKNLKSNAVEYVFLGRELGARSEDTTCYKNGQVQFDLVAETSLFKEGLARLLRGMKTHRICIMCSEKDPLSCHRAILVCRHLRSLDIEIKHILEDSKLETHFDAERRLLQTLKIPERNLFNSFDQQLEKAYDIQSQKIAHAEKNIDE